MVHLPGSNNDNSASKKSSSYRSRIAKTVMRSQRLHIPRYDLPIRFRPWFVGFTVLVMLALAFLGFTNFSHSLPLNDKLLHFLCFMLATGVFYFILDVEDDARHIWYWRHSGLIFTGIACFFFGGILSEFVQSMLPFKTFQIGDVAANLLGSSVGLYVAYNLERYYRHRREISRLYRPLDTDYVSDDEDEGRSAPLLPMHHVPHTAATSPKPSTPKDASRRDRLGDVWNEREEIFDIGADSDDERSTPVRSPRADTPLS